MADQASVFGEQAAPAPVTTPATPAAPANLDNLLSGIKNEAGEQKYKSLEDALVALDNSQKYIPELKSQLTGTQEKLREVEEKMTKFGNIDETVQRLLAQQQTETAATTPVASGLDEQAVLKLVQATLTQNSQAATQVTNQQKVNDVLVGKFGDKAVEVLDAKAAELHTNRQALGELAKQNPDLVLALFGTAPTKDHNPTVGGRRTPDPIPSNGELAKPTKSLLAGATGKEQAARFAAIRNSIHTKYGVEG